MKNWNEDKSLRLSRVCVWLFFAALCAVCAGAPFAVRALAGFATSAGRTVGEVAPWLYPVVYLTAACAALVLWHLHALLRNIAENEVFVVENVGHLRAISWGCLAAGVCFLSGVWYAPSFWVLSAAAAFVGLILRVVKNVFAEAVRLKDENDYTI